GRLPRSRSCRPRTTRWAQAPSTRCAPPPRSRRCPKRSGASPASGSREPSATPLEVSPPMRPTWLAAAGCALALLGSGSVGAQQRCSPVELIYDENEQIAESHKDTNGDCKFDEVVFYKNGVAERAERDTDHDGRTDAWIYFEKDGKTPARQDQDTNGDGKK